MRRTASGRVIATTCVLLSIGASVSAMPSGGAASSSAVSQPQTAQPARPARPALPRPPAAVVGQSAAAQTGTAPADGGTSATGEVLSMAAPLAVVIAVIVIAAAVFRKLARMNTGLAASLGAAGKSPAGVLEVLGRYPAARGHSLVLLKLDRRVLLLSHALPVKGCSGGFSTLCELRDADEVAGLLGKVAEADEGSWHNRFKDIVSKLERESDPATAGRSTAGRTVKRTAEGDQVELWNADAPAEAIRPVGGSGLRSQLAGLWASRGDRSDGAKGGGR